MNETPRFAVGQRFNSSGKHARLCTVTDIHRTYNMAGDLVKLRYVATHLIAGQPVVDHDVSETSIAMRAV